MVAHHWRLNSGARVKAVCCSSCLPRRRKHVRKSYGRRWFLTFFPDQRKLHHVERIRLCVTRRGSFPAIWPILLIWSAELGLTEVRFFGFLYTRAWCTLRALWLVPFGVEISKVRRWVNREWRCISFACRNGEYVIALPACVNQATAEENLAARQDQKANSCRFRHDRCSLSFQHRTLPHGWQP